MVRAQSNWFPRFLRRVFHASPLVLPPQRRQLILLQVVSLVLLSAYAPQPVGAGEDHLIPDHVRVVDGHDNYAHVAPGDRLLIPSTRSTPLTFVNFQGEDGREITIINSGGQVRINGNGESIGIYLKNSEHLRLSGTGDDGSEYGFVIHNVGVCAITTNTDKGSRHIEIDHVEIYDTDGAGICAGRSQTWTRSEWRGYGYFIHHSYLHDIGTEGLYVGSSFWDEGTEPEIEGVEIAYNTVVRCGWDGIQIGSAIADVKVHHNYLQDIGLSTASHSGNTRNGIVVNTGTTGEYYSNRIINAANRAILLLGIGDYRVYNNVIVDAGHLGGDGEGIRWFTGDEGYLYNNTIVNTEGEGIHVASGNTGAVHDNIVVASRDANIIAGDTTAYNNIESDSADTLGFVDTAGGDFHLGADSPAVDAGSDVGYAPVDFDDVARPVGQKPDIGAYEYYATATAIPPAATPSPASTPDPPPSVPASTTTPDPPSGTPASTSTPTTPPPGQRVTDGMQLLYRFEEARGAIVHDLSGEGAPLDLVIEDTSAIDWYGGALVVSSPVVISSVGPATKIAVSCRETNEITLEAWLRPANTAQDGPARVVTFSSDPNERNFTLGQGVSSDGPSDVYDSRLRTTEQSDNGLPSLSSPSGSLTAQLTHVVYTRDASGVAKIYLDGVEVARGAVSGDFSNWDEAFRLALANEPTGTRPWLGRFHLVAIFNRALSQSEVIQNFNAGPEDSQLWPTIWLPLIYRS